MRDAKFKFGDAHDNAKMDIKVEVHDKSGAPTEGIDLVALVQLVRQLQDELEREPAVPVEERRRINRHLDSIAEEAQGDAGATTIAEIKSAAAAIGAIMARVGTAGLTVASTFASLARLLGL